jgi:hypothetical protein
VLVVVPDIFFLPFHPLFLLIPIESDESFLGNSY